MTSYNNPANPEHIPWKATRRRRLVALLREAKRVLKLAPNERALIVELCKVIEQGTLELEKQVEGDQHA